MSFNPQRISVSIAKTESEVDDALGFCRWVYQRNYGTHWTVPPDLFFVAKEDGEIVATGGLTFAALHPQIASVRMQAAKAILHSVLSYCTMADIDFLFAWANPTVYKYTTDRLGLHFWPISVPLDLD